MTAEIQVRRMDFPFSSEIPRWWWLNDPYITHAANGLHLVFPIGERFFVRSVRHYLARLDAPLKARVKQFSGQEAQHGHQHTRAFAILEEQGFEIASYLTWYERRAVFLERLAPPLLRLSVTAALEHFTAVMSEETLRFDRLIDAHPVMRSLLMWHSAEEIEHKSVAFDVYEAVGGGYVVRMLGLFMAAVLLMYFWSVGARHLRNQEVGLSRSGRRQSRRKAREMELDGPWLRRGVRSYVSPGFHPDQEDNYDLARDYFASLDSASA